MSRTSSRASSRVSTLSSVVGEDDESLASTIMQVHWKAGEYILVQSPDDHKICSVKFGSGGSWRQIECERSKVKSESGLQAGDEIYACFSASQHIEQGWYEATVRGVYSTDKECKEAASKLKQTVKRSSEKRKISSTSNNGRNNQLRCIVEAKAEHHKRISVTLDMEDTVMVSDSVQLQLDFTLNRELEPPGDLSRSHSPQPTSSSRKGYFSPPPSLIVNGYTTPQKDMQALAKPRSAERRDIEAKKTVQNMLTSLYWKKPSPNSLQIRPGYEVYIKKPVLRDLMEYYGPDSESRSEWYGYGWQLILHMLGIDEQLVTMKTLLKGVGVDQLLKEPVILTAMGHIQEVFPLKEPIIKSFFKQIMNNQMTNLFKRQT